MEKVRNGFKILTGTHNIVRVIKSKRLKWAGHVVRMEEDRNAFNFNRK